MALVSPSPAIFIVVPVEPRWQRARRRQIVEAVNAELTDVFGLPFPRVRSAWGQLTRVAAKIATLNLGI
jgi:hypothetical protein